MNCNTECPEVTSLVKARVFRNFFRKIYIFYYFGICNEIIEILLINSMEQHTS
jgi:hypothetical protein